MVDQSRLPTAAVQSLWMDIQRCHFPLFYRDEKQTSPQNSGIFFSKPSGNVQISVKTKHKAGMKRKLTLAMFGVLCYKGREKKKKAEYDPHLSDYKKMVMGQKSKWKTRAIGQHTLLHP